MKEQKWNLKVVYILMAYTVCLVLIPQVSFAQSAEGRDGGGGNAIRISSVNQDQLMSYVQYTLKPMLTLWLNAKEFEFEQNNNISGELEALFKDRQGGIFKKLEKLKVELHTEKPCLEGKIKRDASIYPQSEPGAICISFNRISKIWSAQDYESRLAGLVMHELSHLVGADEVQAQNIEQRVIYDLKSVPADRYLASRAFTPQIASFKYMQSTLGIFKNGGKYLRANSKGEISFCQSAMVLEKEFARTRQLLTAQRDGVDIEPLTSFYPDPDQISFVGYKDSLRLNRAHDKVRNILSWSCYGSTGYTSSYDSEMISTAKSGVYKNFVENLTPVRNLQNVNDVILEATEIEMISQEAVQNADKIFQTRSVEITIKK